MSVFREWRDRARARRPIPGDSIDARPAPRRSLADLLGDELGILDESDDDATATRSRTLQYGDQPPLLSREVTVEVLIGAWVIGWEAGGEPAPRVLPDYGELISLAGDLSTIGCQQIRVARQGASERGAIVHRDPPSAGAHPRSTVDLPVPDHPAS